MSLTGSSPNDIEEDVVTKGSGLSRGDKRRNAKLAELRRLVPVDNAILGIDLADKKQAVVVCDHDSRVLARKTVCVKAWDLGPVLDWARRVAHKHGFAGVTVGCEPTGHRWMVLNQLAAQRDMPLVCVNPMLVGRAREAEDYTRDKSDDKDAVLIARLVAQLHCYAPERADETWARLRQLGARRERLITEATACVQQLRDLLECAWPGVLEAAAKPFESSNWCAALAVVLERCDGRPERLARLGLARFEAAVRRELARWGGQRRRPSHHRGGVCRAGRPDRGDDAAARHAGTRPLGGGRLALGHHPVGRGGNPHGRGARRAGTDRVCHQHPGGQRGGGGGDFGRDRRPGRLRQSPRPGQTRRAMPARQCQRHLSWAGRGFPGAADPGCGWPPGARYGGHWRTIRSWPPATST